MILNKKDDTNDELSRRITSDLREKAQKSAEIGNADPDFAEGSEYVKDFQKTGKFAWVWVVLILAALVVSILVIVS